MFRDILRIKNSFPNQLLVGLTALYGMTFFFSLTINAILTVSALKRHQAEHRSLRIKTDNRNESFVLRQKLIKLVYITT